MVDYTTRIIISLTDITRCRQQIIGSEPGPESLRRYGQSVAAAAERAAAMMEVLAEAGFVFTMKKDSVYADSEVVEAVAARRLLQSSGFADREYQIYLEYRRQWGIL